MNKIYSAIAGFLASLSGFHVYLNFANDGTVSFEQSIKILKSNFQLHPVETSFNVLLIILLSVVVAFIFNKIFDFFTHRKSKREDDIKASITNHTNRQNNKDILWNKLIDKNTSTLESSEKPWERINGEFHEIIVRDIHDKKFPYEGQWRKMEVFDLTSDGIEFFDPTCVTGVDVYFDKKHNWDAFHNREKIQKGNFKKAYKAYCTDVLAYEDILHIDWEPDAYYSSPTIFCSYKYKINMVFHPYKEFKYYVQATGYLSPLEKEKRKNFQPLPYRVFRNIVVWPYYRIRYTVRRKWLKKAF